MDYKYENPYSYKLIYVFRIENETHKNLLKVGETTIKTHLPIDHLSPNSKSLNKEAHKRIKQYTTTAGISYKLLHTELAIKTSKNSFKIEGFRDYDVHKVLVNSGIKNVQLAGSKSREWFKVDLDTVLEAIKAVKESKNSVVAGTGNINVPIIFRPEQKDAIHDTIKHFKTSNRMLWNAKMRFGKTLTALKLIKELKFKKSIIITHRPVVDEGWYDDFKKIFYDDENYVYHSKKTGVVKFDELDEKSLVYFASIQDLRGSDLVGGKFTKNEEIFNQNWDLLIVDEAHEGTQTALGDSVIKKLFGKNTKFLALSGTPFNIKDDFDDGVYTWDYIMEQKSKYEWDEKYLGDSNPYSELPELKIYTYDLGDLFKNKKFSELEDKAFNFREFFRVYTGESHISRKYKENGIKIGDFVYKEEIMSFLNLLTREDENSNYPYSNENYRNVFQHTLWMLPGVKEAKALSKLLNEHPVFGSGAFRIINVAGDGDEEEKSEDALKKVRNAINNTKPGEYTITLSCGRLTTGVTVKEWTGVFMLAGSVSTSASLYLQTIFRVQSPYKVDGKIKDKAYVFDFAPDRTLKMIAESATISARSGEKTSDKRKVLGEFLNFCPIISVSGTKMTEYSVSKLFQELKRAYADRAVKTGFDDINLYNDNLYRLEEKELEKFKNLQAEIGKSASQKKNKDVTVNDQGMSDEEYEEAEGLEKKPKRELTPEEKKKLERLKEIKQNARNARNILRAISIRIPLLIYGLDIDIEKDISLKDLVEKIDDSSWREFMPKGVDKELFKEFIKYYDEDVFIAAGRRLRNMVKSADNLDPIQRIGKIVEVIEYFKNPDKETVITPWRVVNLHLAKTIGGYSFYSDDFSGKIKEPQRRIVENITEKVLFKKNPKILEINSKTGVYPLYVVFSIYQNIIENTDDLISNEEKQELWKQIIKNNIFIVCKTKMAKVITKRTLLGYNDGVVNSRYFEDLIMQFKDKSNKIRKKIVEKFLIGGENMFDAVVGNPPYQESKQDTSDAPIYHYFMSESFKLAPRVTLITPGRFLFNAGKTPKKWNNAMLNDPHFKVVHYESNSLNIFSTADIKGGVAITYRDSTQNFGEIGTFSIYPELNSLLKKVKRFNEGTIDQWIYTQNKFNLTNLYKDFPEYEQVVGSNGKEKRITTNAFDKFEIFKDEKKSDEDICIVGLEKNDRVLKWLNKAYLEPHENLDHFKVILPKSNGSGAIGEVLSTPLIGEPLIGEPLIGHTQTFISIGKFSEKNSANACFKYIKTKFARVLLGTLKVTQDNNKETWKNVPVQNFNEDSDIDWSKSIREIDRQLYEKYSLSNEEINFIEEKVKEMS